MAAPASGSVRKTAVMASSSSPNPDDARRRDPAMKAAVIHQHGGPGCIRYDANFPDPVAAPGEVVVKVGAASLNYHDVFTRNGMPGITVPMPIIMGLDFAGEIVEVGK